MIRPLAHLEFKLALIIIASTALTNILVFFSLSYFYNSFTLEVIILSILSTFAFIFPGVYFFICKPLKANLIRYKQTEISLERLMRQNELILEAAGEGIIGINCEGLIIFVNPSALKMLGYSLEELIGENHHEKIHYLNQNGQKYEEEHCPVFKTCKYGTTNKGQDEIFWRKDGSSFPIEYMSTPMIENGQIIGAVVTFRDLTERKKELQEIEEKLAHLEYLWSNLKKAEEAQKESEKRYRNFFNESRDSVFMTSALWKFTDINQSAIELFEYDANEIFRLHFKELFMNTDDFLNFEQVIKKYSSVKDFEAKLIKKSGLEIDCLITASTQIDDEGNILGYYGMIHDITDRKKLEQQLLQAQKMEAVGRLAGGVAHDFNNILTAIIGYGKLLKEEMEPDNPLQNYTTQILNSAERAANLTRALLTFSRKQIISPKPVNINDLINGITRLLNRLIGEDIELITYLSEKDLTIMADSTQIEQVLMNLATNARDAMPDGGTLIIKTDLVVFDAEYIKVHGYGKPGGFALISVEDTGSGIDEKIKERIFEPFFTTKEVGKGTGLGLAMVYGIIRQHDGYINVYSVKDKGTTFKIYLPLIKSVVEENEDVDKHYTEGGSETILLAEDDTLVRTLCKKVLEKAGYYIIEALDGEDALNIFKERSKDIQLLLLDVIMPKKNGRECYDEMKKIRPDIKVVFMSGYTADIIHKKGIIEEGIELLLKPISPNILLRKVREVLDRKSESTKTIAFLDTNFIK